MILTKGRCDPPFLSQLGFGEGVRGWWVGVLEFLGGLRLGRKVFWEVVEIGVLEVLGILELGGRRGFGGYLRFRGFLRNMRSKLKTSINIQKFNSNGWYM